MALNITRVEPPKIKVVDVLPSLREAEIGEMFFLIDGGSNTNKIHIRVTSGWLKTAALT